MHRRKHPTTAPQAGDGYRLQRGVLQDLQSLRQGSPEPRVWVRSIEQPIAQRLLPVFVANVGLRSQRGRCWGDFNHSSN